MWRQLLITDADNTLWDTDQIYAKAQLKLLSDLEAVIGVMAKEDDRLEVVRRVDQAIAAQHPMRLNYPAEVLVDALTACLVGTEVHAAVDTVLRADSVATGLCLSSAQRQLLAATFLAQIREQKPLLRSGVRETLWKLKELAIPVVILSEGVEDRVLSIVRFHALESAISHMVFQRKTAETYKAIAVDSQVELSSVFVVGDQIDCDVAVPRSIGCHTIFFPCGFKPFWTATHDVEPDFKISDYRQVFEILLEQRPTEAVPSL